jgi:hypothetical protein
MCGSDNRQIDHLALLSTKNQHERGVAPMDIILGFPSPSIRKMLAAAIN